MDLGTKDRIKMSDRPSHNLDGLDIDLARQIDAVCRRFEADWRAGTPTAYRGLSGRRARRRPPRAPGRAGGPGARAAASRRSTVPRPESGPATTPEPQTALGPSTVAEAPTIAPGTPPTSPSRARRTPRRPRGVHPASRRRRLNPRTICPPPPGSIRPPRWFPCSRAGPHPLLRRLRDHPRDRPRRHGRRLPGPADEPQPPRRAQDDPGRPARQRDRRQALPHRGRGRGQSRSPRHRPDLRGRPARGAALLLDGLRRGPEPVPAAGRAGRFRPARRPR